MVKWQIQTINDSLFRDAELSTVTIYAGNYDTYKAV